MTDRRRLRSDRVYNMQMGAPSSSDHIGAL